MKIIKLIFVIIFSILTFYCITNYVYSFSLLIENKTSETYVFRANKFTYTNKEIAQIEQATNEEMVIIDTFLSNVYPGPTYEYSEMIDEEFHTTTNFSSINGNEYYVGYIPIDLMYSNKLVGEEPQNSDEVAVDINYCMQQYDVTNPTDCIGRTIDVYSNEHEITYTITGVYMSSIVYGENSNSIFLYQPSISYEELTLEQQRETDKYLYDTYQITIDENTSRISFVYADSVDSTIKSCDDASDLELCYEEIIANDTTDIAINLVRNSFLAAVLLFIFIMNYSKLTRKDIIVSLISITIAFGLLSLFKFDVYNVYHIISYIIMTCFLILLANKFKLPAK